MSESEVTVDGQTVTAGGREIGRRDGGGVRTAGEGEEGVLRMCTSSTSTCACIALRCAVVGRCQAVQPGGDDDGQQGRARKRGQRDGRWDCANPDRHRRDNCRDASRMAQQHCSGGASSTGAIPVSMQTARHRQRRAEKASLGGHALLRCPCRLPRLHLVLRRLCGTIWHGGSLEACMRMPW